MSDPVQTSSVAIFARLFDPEKIGLSADAAESLLKVGFAESDQQRMHELAVKNQEGMLTAEEELELENYVLTGRLLTVMHSRARQSLLTLVNSSSAS